MDKMLIKFHFYIDYSVKVWGECEVRNKSSEEAEDCMAFQAGQLIRAAQ